MPIRLTFSEGSGLNDSVYGKCQAPIRMFLEKRGEAFEQESVVERLFLMGTSENYGDLLTSMTAMAGFEPVGENGAYPEDSMQEGYQKLLVYETWKDSFSISKEMIEDSKLMDLRKQPGAFMTSYHRTRELFGAALYAAPSRRPLRRSSRARPLTSPRRTASRCSPRRTPPRCPAPPSATCSRTPSPWMPWARWRRPCRFSAATRKRFWTCPRTPF